MSDVECAIVRSSNRAVESAFTKTTTYKPDTGKVSIPPENAVELSLIEPMLLIDVRLQDKSRM
jgi:hypothetical protein